MKTIAIIPARGGSKSIPHKNIYPILGKPLIQYTIEAAQKATSIDRVIVTTDDPKIADIAKKSGAEVPFLRPKELSEDDTPDLPVFKHAISWLKEKEDYCVDTIVHLWPTSPLRKDGDIDTAITLLEKNPGATSVRSVTSPSQIPFKMWRMDKGKYLVPILKKEYPETYENSEPHALPRQLLPETVVQTGYFAVIRSEIIMNKNSMFGDAVIPFFHEPDTYTELDSLKDLHHTEYIINSHLSKNKENDS